MTMLPESMRKKDSPRFSLPASRAALKACKDYTASPSKEKTHSCLYGIGTHLTIGHILLLLCIFTTDTKIAGPSSSPRMDPHALRGGCSHSALWPSCRSMSFRPAQSPIFCISSDSSLSRDCIHSCLAGIHLFIFAISHHFLTLSETCKNAVRTFVLVSCYASRILLVQAEKGGKHPWARTRYTILSSRR